MVLDLLSLLALTNSIYRVSHCITSDLLFIPFMRGVHYSKQIFRSHFETLRLKWHVSHPDIILDLQMLVHNPDNICIIFLLLNGKSLTCGIVLVSFKALDCFGRRTRSWLLRDPQIESSPLQQNIPIRLWKWPLLINCSGNPLMAAIIRGPWEITRRLN